MNTATHKPDTITKTIFLAAPPQAVWQYLTEKNKLKTWFHPAESDLAVGKDYALIREDQPGSERLCWGKVLSMTPPHSMVWTFTVAPLNGAMTTVTWTLEAIDDGTRLTLVHEGVSDAMGDTALGLIFALDPGWDEHFGRLRLSLRETATTACAASE